MPKKKLVEILHISIVRVLGADFFCEIEGRVRVVRLQRSDEVYVEMNVIVHLLTTKRGKQRNNNKFDIS